MSSVSDPVVRIIVCNWRPRARGRSQPRSGLRRSGQRAPQGAAQAGLDEALGRRPRVVGGCRTQPVSDRVTKRRRGLARFARVIGLAVDAAEDRFDEQRGFVAQRVVEDGGDGLGGERVPGPVGGEGGDEIVDEGPRRGHEEVFLGGEELVERAFADADLVADVADAHVRESVGRELTAGDGEDPGPGLRRGVVHVGGDHVLPHPRPERLLVPGEELGQDPPDGGEAEPPALPQQADQPQGLDVAVVVDEPVRRHAIRWREQPEALIVVDCRGGNPGTLHQVPQGEGRFDSHGGTSSLERRPGQEGVDVDRTLLLTDSNVCLPRENTRRLGIRIVPITILLDGASVADDSIDPAVVFRAIARDDTVKSSPPSVIDYLTVIEDDGYDGALVLTPASEFTSMFLHATQAAGIASRPVRVVDTRTAAAAQRLVVLEVARACRRGAGLDELERIARDAAGRVELVATLDRVSTIERSGRVPAPVLAAAERGGGFSAFRFRDGSVMPLRRAGTDPLALVHDVWARSGGPDASAACVFHAGVPERADALRARLTGSEPVIPFSPAMAIHTGPGVVGVAWLRAPAPGSTAPAVG